MDNTTQVGDRNAVFAALQALGYEVMLGKDSGFYVRGQGWKSLAWARKMTGIAAPEREFRGTVSAYGDWAMIGKINGIK